MFIERKWVDRALPEREVLDSLAHCYGVLSSLLKSAHEQADVTYTFAMHTPEGPSILEPVPAHGGRLPCMVTTLAARTTQYRMSDGAPVVGGYSSVASPSARTLKRGMRRYELHKLEADLAKPRDSLMEVVDPLLEQAKRMLKADKHHIFLVILFKGAKPIRYEEGRLTDRSAKFAYSQEIARQVAVSGADGVVTIGEIWQSGAVVDEDGVLVSPAEVPDRREGLQVAVEDRHGNRRVKVCFFRKRFNRIVFEEEVEFGHEVQYNFMVPVRAVWEHWDERSDDTAR